MLTWGNLLFAHDLVPGKPQRKAIALVGGTVYTVSHGIIPDGAVVFDKGVITAVGKKEGVVIPPGADVIDASGKMVYPGLIAPNTHLGLIEIGQVRATRDLTEVGEINPNARADMAYNPDSEIIPAVRANGIAVALVVPGGNLLAGTSSLMMLDGWTAEDAALVKGVGVHLHWPRLAVTHAWWMEESEEEQKKKAQQSLRQMEEAFRKARQYWLTCKSSANAQFPKIGERRETHILYLLEFGEILQPLIDARWEAMLPLFDGTRPLFVHASSFEQIEAAVAFCREQGFKMVLVGGADSWKATHLLKQGQIPVILQSTHNLPQREDEGYDLPYRLPKILHDAGVKFCLSEEGFWEVQNLPFQAATAVAFGLDKDAALCALTLWPAEIFGVADKIGSLEVGKQATLIVSAGDILDVKSNHVEYMFIQGRLVDLDNRHKKLYRKYQAKSNKW